MCRLTCGKRIGNCIENNFNILVETNCVDVKCLAFNFAWMMFLIFAMPSLPALSCWWLKTILDTWGKTFSQNHCVICRTWGKAPGFWGYLKAQHAVGGECMFYTRFDTSPSLATLTKFNLGISINRSEGTCPQINRVQPLPSHLRFFVTRHSVISFRGKLWVQAISHACPGQRFLDNASILL